MSSTDVPHRSEKVAVVVGVLQLPSYPLSNVVEKFEEQVQHAELSRQWLRRATRITLPRGTDEGWSRGAWEEELR